jgi:hypothetical protein
MDKPIREEGFVVRQEVSGSAIRFFSTREEAEEAAMKMLDGYIPTLVLPAVRYTTKATKQWRGEKIE